MVRAWKLSVEFFSPMVFYHRPMLDGMLTYALERELQPYRCLYIAPKWATREWLGINELPKIVQVLDDIPLTTFMQPARPQIEYADSWKKLFDSKHVRLADFGKARRRIDTGSGKYRSYNVPLPAYAVNGAWWGMIGDGPRVLKLMQKFLPALGKKGSEGFGFVREYTLEEASFSVIDILSKRPVPMKYCQREGLTFAGVHQQCAYKPPYWDNANVEICLCPQE